jgi:hypothetical protein
MDNHSIPSTPAARNAKSAQSANSKRKWREIEQLKEQFELERSLKEFDDSFDYALDDY